MDYMNVVNAILRTLQLLQSSHSQGGQSHGLSASSSSEAGQAQENIGHSLVPQTQILFGVVIVVLKLARAASQT